MSYEVGCIYHVNSFSEVLPSKGKFGICVSVGRGYFFAINTENRAMYDCILISASDHPQLKIDRYVSCKAPLTVPSTATIEKKYKASETFVRQLIEKVKTSKFLTLEARELITSELGSLLPNVPVSSGDSSLA